jgi:hypothetical protein
MIEPSSPQPHARVQHMVMSLDRRSAGGTAFLPLGIADNDEKGLALGKIECC